MSLFYREREFSNAETAHQEILNNVSGSFHAFFLHTKRDSIQILSAWISAKPGESKEAREFRRRTGQSRHMLVFQDYTNMARAVMGEFLSASNLEESENPLASKTINSSYIDDHLAGLLVKIRLKIEQEGSGSTLRKLLDKLDPPRNGPYQPLYRNKGATTIPDVLAEPAKFNFSDKIVTLYDVMDYLTQAGKLQVPTERCLGTYFRITDTGAREYSRKVIQGTADFRFNDKDQDGGYVHYTLKESAGHVMAARIHGIPIWAGPSFTTARLMTMTEWADATLEQKKAMAWGIFAFWNQCYPQHATWIHRYHAVMDMAANFGVVYWPFVYPKDIPPNDRQ